MPLRYCYIVITLFMLLDQTAVHAASFGHFDPRSLAMGGTGVSSALSASAAYYNPALLSAVEEDNDFTLLVPTIGARLYDPQNLISSMEDYQDGKFETTFNNAIDTFNDVALIDKISEASNVTAATQQLLNGLKTLDDKVLDFEVHGGVSLAVPNKTLGVGIIGTGRVMGGVVLDITDDDTALIQKYLDTLEYVASGTASGTLHTDIYNDGTKKFEDPEGKLTSKALLRGATVIENGISLAHEFESLEKLSIGITHKTVSVTTFDYDIGVENAELDDDAVDNGQLEYNNTNFDLGFAKSLTRHWRMGLVIKNVLKKQYQTVLGHTIVLRPQKRIGISHHTNLTTLAVDLDLDRNESIGLTGETTQYAAVGMELDLSLIQLRLGARHNLKAAGNVESNAISAGVGLYIFGLHADVGVAVNDDELEAAAQLGIQF